jgi:hypothetical protein
MGGGVLPIRRSEIGADTLHRLTRLDTGGVPVLSVYLDLDPARFPTPAARGADYRALVARARREAEAAGAPLGEHLDADIDRVRRIFETDPVLVRGARALAIFSAAGADILEVVGVPSSVDPMAIVDSVAWLEPLAGAMGPQALSTLEQRRVEALLVLEGAHLVAGRCPRCGGLFASAPGACRADGSPLGAVDAGERATELAARQSAEVVVVRHETTWLRERGAIAALLRW